MKPFLLFAGPSYYPRGGAADFISAHDTLEEAQASVPERIADGWSEIGWAQVARVEGETMVILISAQVPDGHRLGGSLRWDDGWP